MAITAAAEPRNPVPVMHVRSTAHSGTSQRAAGTNWANSTDAASVGPNFDTVALVGRLQIRAAAFVQLGRVRLYPPPDAAGVNFDPAFRQEFGDVLVGNRVSEIPTYAQNDNFSGVLALFERIVSHDRHGLLPYQAHVAEVRNGTLASASYRVCRARARSLKKDRLAHNLFT